MSRASRRVAVTGVGLVTPLGRDRGSFWEALVRGRSGVRPLQSFDAQALPSRFGGEVLGFDARDYLEKKDRKRLTMMSRTIQFAVGSARLAWADAGLEAFGPDPERVGVVLGAGTVPGDLTELAMAARASVAAGANRIDLERWGDEGIACVPPTWMLLHIPNMLSCHVSILHNAQGPNNTIIQSDAASLLALGEAYRKLGRGQADLFLVGGADTKILPINAVRNCLFGEVSRRNDDPARACRPFDRGRDGLVLAEGGCILVLEEWQHAVDRGATLYAEVLGFAATFDRDGSGHGLARAIHSALDEAGVLPDEIDHVNAHGLSTVAEDAFEARALQEVFGTRAEPVPVFAAKSYFGNLGAGGGSTELTASLLALRHGLLPRTLNYEVPDPACPVFVPTEVRPITRPYFLKVSFTDMGQCAAAVFRAPE